MKFLITSVLLLSGFVLYGQSGALNLQEEGGVSVLMYKYRTQNEAKKSVPGYRIQIAQEYKSEQVYEKESDFNDLFPQLPTYVTYKQPYFKLRAGNFTDRLEAFRALKLVKRKFDSAFLVPFEIDVSRLKY